jgi:transketolase
MIPKDAQLEKNLFDKDKLKGVATRTGYGEGLKLAGEENISVVALCADLTESTATLTFKNVFPDRFVEIGVAEQNLASVASGMAAMGKVPFIASYAMFSPGRSWEQIRTTICYNEQNVKIVGAHAGVSVGPDGATHQAVEDMAIMRVIPNMVVLSPCDAIEAKKATIVAARYDGPVYIRFHREKTPVFTTEETSFDIGRAEVFYNPKDAPDVVVIGTGPVVHNALLAAEELSKKGIKVRVINCPSVKPLDEKTILASVRDAGCIVTVEEHQRAGGLGSAIAELTSRMHPVPIEFLGVADRFGESGDPNELVEYFGMGVSHISEAIEKVIKRKK